MAIPVIDERVRYVGVTALRGLNTKALGELSDLLVVQVDEKPVAVIIPIAMYLEIQKALWPSSLVTSLGQLFASEPTLAPGVAEAVQRIVDSEVTALAEEEDARAADLVYLPEPPVGVMPSPSDTLSTSERITTTPGAPELHHLLVPVCAHCCKPSDKPLCGPCFLAGHRSGCCQQCAEVNDAETT